MIKRLLCGTVALFVMLSIPTMMTAKAMNAQCGFNEEQAAYCANE